jgi:hypothetical protein
VVRAAEKGGLGAEFARHYADPKLAKGEIAALSGAQD